MKKLLFLAVLLLVFSCEKEIEYEGEGKAPLLVLDAILENDSTPFVKVSRSVFFLSNSSVSDAAISDADVRLTNLDSGDEYILNGGGSGYYLGSEIVLPNTRYRIEVSHPDYETISSEIQTVSNIILSGIDSSSAGLQYEKKYYVNYELNDPQEANFYAVKLFVEREITTFDSNMAVIDVDTTWTSPYLFSGDPSFDFRFDSEVMFFNDVIFNGTAKVFPTEFNNYSIYGGGGWNDQSTRVIGYEATLLNFSEDAYKYFKSTKNNQASDPFSDPVNVHTNVENGLGIFGSVSSSVVEL